MSLFWIQFALILICIGIGGRFGGIGLGAAGGLGLGILTFGFGLKPDSPPITVMLIILAVITCVTILQAAGGLDFLVHLAERMLRKRPNSITFLGPAVTYLFTIFCGTSYVAFSVYPVIAEIAIEAKVRPERAMSMSVISSNMALIASPMSAAMTGMIAIMAGLNVTPLQILAITVPGTVIGCAVGCLFMNKCGKELVDDPIYQQKIASGELKIVNPTEEKAYVASREAKLGVVLFLLAIVAVILLGSISSLRPDWTAADGTISKMPIPTALQIIMLMTSCLIMIFCKINPSKLDSGPIFKAGLVGVVAIFGLAWMVGTFFEAYSTLFKTGFLDMSHPWLFGIVLFLFSIVIYSPSATVAALMPVGVMMGLPAAVLVGLLPAACATFIIPGAGQIACVAFDRTGSTRIGKYVINHSYTLPGMLSLIISTVACLLIAQVIL